MAASDKRHANRARLDTPGVAIQVGERCFAFQTLDVTLNGTCIEVRGGDFPEVGAVLRVLLLAPGFGAKAVVRWTRPGKAGTTLAGLQFLTLDFINTPPPVSIRPTYYA